MEQSCEIEFSQGYLCMRNRVLSGLPLVCGGLAVATLIAQSSTSVRADTLHVTDDAYIDADKSGKNTGDGRIVKLKDDGGDDDRIGFVRFKLSTLPNDVAPEEIVKATLRLWIEKVSDDGILTLQRPGGAWDEEDLTADNAPAIGTASTNRIDITEDDEESFVLFDVTDIVKAWVSRRAPNDGIVLVPGGGLKAEAGAKETKDEHAMEIEVALGETGPQGERGPRGFPGANNDALHGITIRSTDSVNSANDSRVHTQLCGNNEIRVGCSAAVIANGQTPTGRVLQRVVNIYAVVPTVQNPANGCRAFARETETDADAASWRLRVFAYCQAPHNHAVP